jgi:hypothetical protein
MDIGQPEGEAKQNSVIGVLIGREWEMVLEWQHVSGSAHTCVTSRKGNPGARSAWRPMTWLQDCVWQSSWS